MPVKFSCGACRAAFQKLGFCLGLLFPFAGSPLLAAEAWNDSPFSIQGFGTLGMARTSSDDVHFVRDLSQPKGVGTEWSAKLDSVLGLQATWSITPEWAAVVQGVSRYRYDGRFTPEISWAYAKYDPSPSVSLRAGQLGTEFFMLADSRWCGYSFLTVRPPGDYCWYLPFYGIRGGDATFSTALGDGLLRSKVFYGHAEDKVPLATEQWDVRGSPMLGGYVEYQRGPWLLRGSYANLRFKNDLPYGPVLEREKGISLPSVDADYLSARNTRTHYYALGLVYDSGPWQGQLMLNHIEQGNKALESSDGGYALLGRRFGSVTPFVGYSRVYSRPRSAPTAISTELAANSHSDQHTNFAGIRWDAARNVAVKAQWDAIRGNRKSIFPYRNESQNWSGKLDVFSLTMDFVF